MRKPESANPILTIGMPVYNGEKYLEEAIESLLLQEYENFVLIVSDNASTDGTSEILRRFSAKDRRVVVFRQERNLGATANFRFVLDKCDTPYFSWAAADDRWHSQWVSKLMENATQSRCLSFGTLVTIDEHGKSQNHPANKRVFTFSGSHFKRRISYFLMPGLFGKANPIYGIFRKEDFTSEVWEQFASASYGGDVAALYMMLNDVPIVSRQDTYIFKRRHRQNGASVSATGHRKRKPPFRKTMLLMFFRQSRFIEKIFIIFLYPLAAAGSIFAKMMYLWLRVADQVRGN